MLAEIKGSLKLLRLGLSEAVWQTRCVICDVPGVALCDKCSRELPYLDQLSACPLCGAPWGRGICCECNQQTLRWKGLTRFPLDGCVSAVLLSPETKRIVTVFKDRGEQQLSEIIAHHMANVFPPSWQAEAVLVPIPARTNAVRKRGFDHISLIGAELSRITGMPLTPLLRAKPRRDQRDLDARQRLANMVGSFDLEPNGPSPYGNALKARLGIMPRIVLIDDVFTTGATLFTAGNTLRAAGAKEIYAVTFIRA